MDQLNSEFERLEKLRDDNYFISRQDLEPYLEKLIEKKSELYIIFFTSVDNATENIISTLSIVYKNKKFHYPNNIEELYTLSAPIIIKSLRIHNDESADQKREETKKKRYRPENSNYTINKSDIKLYTSILGPNVAIITNQFLEDTILKKTLYAANIFRQASPNLMNSSLLLSLRDAEEFALNYNNSITNTAINFRDIIIKLYKIDCVLIEKNFETGSHNSINKRENFNMTNFMEVLKYGRPVFNKIGKINYLVFPFCNDRQTYSINYYLVLKSINPIKKFILTNLSKATNYYFNSYLSNVRLQHISDLQKRIIHIHSNKDSLIKGINFDKKLKDFCTFAFRPLIEITGVFSATIRLYNPFNQELRLIHEEPKSKRINIDRTISIKNKNNSVNFLTFDNCNKKTFFYCKDVPLFKSNRAKLDIDRDTTKTELCFPLYFKDVKIGTVNFESPLAQAFGKQLNLYHRRYYFNFTQKILGDDLFNYFLTIRNLIQEYAELLFESNDKLWLVERIQNYQNIHELKSLILNPKIPNESKKTITKAIGISPYILSGKKTISLKKIVENFYSNYFNTMIEYNSVTLNIMKSKISIDINDEILIDLESRTYLDILLQNIFKNFHTYHDIYNDFESVNINLIDGHLIIQQNFTFYNYKKSLANQYLIKPYHSYEIVDQKGKKQITHLGLFLVGMLVRQLRGTCYINLPKIERNKNSTLLIKIPF